MKNSFTISATETGKRIDVLCAQKFSEISRSQWTRFGKFFLEGRAQPPKTKVKLGDCWEARYDPILDSSEITPWDFPIKILKETETWAVVEKPSGVSVHPSCSEKSGKTLIHALRHHFGENLSESYEEINGKFVPRFGLVHRLDKGTSGVLLIAKNQETHRKLQENWKKTEKIYYAIVSGIPPLKGKIESGILRDPENRKKMKALDTEVAKWAITEFERLSVFGNFSRLKIRILTGRTHQIRVHLSSIGFPVLGDTLYGGKRAERVFLHAELLSFPDPISGTLQTVVSEIPKEFFLTING